MKRLLAYSSVEHMGILAIGMSFSATIAVVGVLLQVLAHAAAKGTAFFGVGSAVRKFGTKDMTKIRGGIGALPWSGPMLVLAVLALSAMPPFGIFRSEFDIVYGGLSQPRDVIVAIFVVLVIVAFFGLSWFTTETMLSEDPSASLSSGGAIVVDKGEVSNWIVAAMLVGLVALLILGVHPPTPLVHLLDRAAAELRGSR
jgi:hydrogenase-4 component F